jgi:glutamine synthetase
MAYAAALAAGLSGVRDHVEPPAQYQGNAYAASDLPRIPTSLREAIGELEGSALAREAFGEDVVEHYLQFLRTEQRKFDGAVTDWERARFFERG